MLKLERLEVNGFKTFVEPVVSHFAPGITAIVGPNGCGKSNLAEAVTWVLGEQSAKSLRGSSMEEVIFNGTHERKPLGFAEVSLSFRTDGSIEEAEDGRITIGRRIFRGGEGQYRLNDRVVRLKDIRDILMDTGLGIRAYSVIEQGRIGMILSGRPQDRRKLIEEAAGITRYKNRKRLATLKLEDATADLLRLDDIILEVEKRLRSLKRQANAARRYGERRKVYRELLEIVLQERWGRLHLDLDDLATSLKEETDREADLAADLARANAELTECREEIDVRTQDAVRFHERQAKLLALIEGRQEQIKGARTTLDEIAERLESGGESAARRRRDLAAAQEQLEKLLGRREKLESRREQALSDVQEDRRRIGNADATIAQARKEQRRLLGELATCRAGRGELRQRLIAERIGTEKATDRRDRARTTLDRSQRDLDAINDEIDAVRSSIESLAGALDEETETARRVSDDLEANRNRRKQAQGDLEARREDLVEAQKRAAVLDELGERDARQRNEMRQALVDLGLAEPRFLGDEVTVPEGWENSLDLFLGPLRNAVMTPEDEDALAIARSIGGSDFQATLLRSGHLARPVPAVEDPAIVSDLAEALGLSGETRGALPPAYLVESAEDAERLAPEHPGIAFLCRDRLWIEAGRVTVRGEQAALGALGRQREMDDLRVRIAELEEQREALADEIEDADECARQAAAEGQRLERVAAELRQDLAVAKSRLQDIGERRTTVRGEYDAAQSEFDEMEGAIEESGARRQEIESELADTEQQLATLQEAADEASAAVEEAREEREEHITAGAGRQGELDLIDERASSEKGERKRIEDQITSLKEENRAWAGETETLRGRISEHETAAATARRELDEALAERTDAVDEAAGAQRALDDERERGRTLDARIRELGTRRDELRDVIEGLRVREAGLRQDAEHLGQDYRQEFGRDLAEQEPHPEADGDVGAPSAGRDTGTGEPPDLEAMTAELDRQRALLERMGPVNVLAADEYDEHQERHEFLTGQRADVTESIESLRRTIRDIDKTSSERFVAAFREVNENFGRIFTELFRGGEAEMRLMDEDDPLDCGIEITARPPGKRVQNIMLLSGGEKALAAIALLFALFQTKPSPFCILDEVDAPLDDANILRFIEMLKRMSGETQFLVITHNKLTMQAASTLYGVTMEERGVSKIVGVDVDEMHPEQQLATA